MLNRVAFAVFLGFLFVFGLGSSGAFGSSVSRPCTTTISTVTSWFTTTVTTTEPGTTTTPTTPGEVIFNAGFDSGSYAPWLCCGLEGGAGNPTLVTSTVDNGGYAARFDLPANTSSKTRSEFGQYANTYNPPMSTMNLYGNDYYSLAIQLPAGFDWAAQGTFPGIVVAQLNQNTRDINVLWTQVLTLKIVNGNLQAVIMSGVCHFGTGCSTVQTPTLVPTMQTGVWYEVLLHGYWSDQNDGRIEGWWRAKGGTFAKSVDFSGPTFQWNETISASQANTAPAADKQGAYRSANDLPVTIYQDSFCRATSFDAAASCLG